MSDSGITTYGDPMIFSGLGGHHSGATTNIDPNNIQVVVLADIGNYFPKGITGRPDGES